MQLTSAFWRLGNFSTLPNFSSETLWRKMKVSEIVVVRKRFSWRQNWSIYRHQNLERILLEKGIFSHFPSKSKTCLAEGALLGVSPILLNPKKASSGTAKIHAITDMSRKSGRGVRFKWLLWCEVFLRFAPMPRKASFSFQVLRDVANENHFFWRGGDWFGNRFPKMFTSYGFCGFGETFTWPR